MSYTNRPIPVQLEEGVRVFCTCGRSADKPFCDGSHPDSSWPQRTDIIRAKNYLICDCGLSAVTPFCDGSHTGGGGGCAGGSCGS